MLLEEKDIEEINGIKKQEKKRLIDFLKPKSEIQDIKQNSKFNCFFILMVKDEYRKYLSISTFEDNGIIRKNIKNFECIKIHEANYLSKKDESVKFFIFQVISDKKINYLSIKITDKFYKCQYNSQIVIGNNDCYFLLNTLNFEEDNDFFDASYSIIMKEYLSCFFDEAKKIDEKFKKNLLKSILDKIGSLDNLELKPDEILRFFKYCCDFKIAPKLINSLEIRHIKEGKFELNKKYYISDEDIEKIEMNLKKTKFLNLLVEIYSLYDSNYLLKLMKSKYNKDFSRATLDLLINNKIKFKDLLIKEEDFNNFQNNLLTISEKKDEINYIIKLSKGLYSNLSFIRDKFQIISKILEDNAKVLRWKSTNYQLSLVNAEEGDDIDKIFLVLSDIIDLSKNKNYKIVDYEEIFTNLLNFYANKDLNDLCKLHNIVNILKKEKLSLRLSEKFYNTIHQKGLFLIKNKKLKPEEIIQFLAVQDIYYWSPSFVRNENRDSEIFKYIPITDEDQNYLLNIKLIKENKLWTIFSENPRMQTKFYQILIDQMKKVLDFKSIFDIFPINSINKEFTFLINGKFKDIIFTVLDEKKENFEILYKIFDDWIIINHSCDLNLDYVVGLLEINYDLTSKYFFYLLKEEKMQFITRNIKNLIIDFFTKQNQEGGNNAESLISLLLISTNEYRLYFLNQLNKEIMTEKDFYQKEETNKFLLFKLFFEKCNDLIKDKEIAQGEYLFQTILVKNKIYNDLQNNDIPFNTLNNLIEKEDILYNKILVITGNEDEAKKFFDKIKENLQKCEKIFEELKTVEDFYTTFYNLTKEHERDIIKRKTIELKNKNVSELIKMGNNIFEGNNEFNYEEAKEESKNIKYKNSCLFMAIYFKNKDNQGIDSEDKIFKDTVSNFKESLTKIIQQKDMLIK